MDEVGDQSVRARNPLSSENIVLPARTRSWSKQLKMFCWVAFPTAMAVVVAVSPLIAVLLFILLLPTIWLFFKWNSSHSGTRADPETMLWLYLATGTLGTFTVILIESVLSYGLANLVFQSEVQAYLKEWALQEKGRGDSTDAEWLRHVDARREMASRWQYKLFLVLACYFPVAVVEEGLKYSSLLLVRRFRPLSRDSEYITYAMTSALGFGALEAVMFIYQACLSETGPRIVLFVLERVLVAAPAHAITSCLLAITVIRRDLHGEKLRLWQVMRLPVFLHGSFDFMVLSISAMNGKIGWVHPEGGKSLLAILVFGLGIPLIAFVMLRARMLKYEIQL